MKGNQSWIISAWNISVFFWSKTNQLEQQEKKKPAPPPRLFLLSISEPAWILKKHDKNYSANNLLEQLRKPGCERNEAWNKLIRASIQQEESYQSNELGGVGEAELIDI